MFTIGDYTELRKELIMLMNMKKRNGRFFGTNNIEFNLMVLPGLLLIILFNYIPMGGLVIAFQNYKFNKGIFGSEFIGFENFKFFFTSADAGRVLKNTLLLNFSFIICGMAVAIILALCMFKLTSTKLIKTLQTGIMLPYFLSWVIVGCMAYTFLNPTSGVLNNILETFSLEPVDWYSKPKLWPFILGFFSVWKNMGYNCIMYYAGLMGIDKTLFEAADIDGVGSFGKIIYIAIPSIVPLICTLFLLNLGGIFRSDFGLFYQLTRDIGVLYPTTDVIDTYIFRALKTNGDVGMSAAVGLFQSVVGFITVVTANKIVSKISSENALF